MKIAGTIVLLLISAMTASAQREYCFKNDGLKNVSTITFKVDGRKVEGNYKSAPYYDDRVQLPIRFTGTLSGKVMTVKFDTKVPEEFTHIKTLTWTLGTALKVQMYGKNYTTNRWGVYAATFDKCGEVVVNPTAKELYFAKGKSELTETLTLAAGGSRGYVIGGRSGQVLSVDASRTDVEVSLISGKIAAFTTGPGHYDAVLLANADYVFEVKNTSAKELTATITVVIDKIHVNK
jgi:hypothetical protein